MKKQNNKKGRGRQSDTAFYLFVYTMRFRLRVILPQRSAVQPLRL